MTAHFEARSELFPAMLVAKANLHSRMQAKVGREKVEKVVLWPDRPTQASLLRLWHFFRITTLGAIWRIRCSRLGRSHQGSFARRVAKLVIASTNSAISRDWTRTQCDVRTLDDGTFCTDWWRGFDARLPLSQFIATWALPPIFCTVAGAPPLDPAAPDTRTLDLRLSASSPLVPLPP